MALFGWLLLFVGFLGLEAAFRCLVALWFAAGALAAALGLLSGLGVTGQLALFAGVSLAVLVLVRPLAFLAARLRSRG